MEEGNSPFHRATSSDTLNGAPSCPSAGDVEDVELGRGSASMVREERFFTGAPRALLRLKSRIDFRRRGMERSWTLPSSESGEMEGGWRTQGAQPDPPPPLPPQSGGGASHASLQNYHSQFQRQTSVAVDIDNFLNRGLSIRGHPDMRAENVRRRRRRKFIAQGLGFLVFIICTVIGVNRTYGELPGVILGGLLLTITTSSSVFLSYLFQPESKKHPNPLIMYRNLCELAFSLKTCVGMIGGCLLRHDCETLSPSLCFFGVSFEVFLLVGGELWFLAAVIDLQKLLTNPFTNYTSVAKMYHVCVWGLAFLVSGLSFMFLFVENHVVPQADATQFCQMVEIILPTINGDLTTESWRNANLIFWSGTWAIVLITLCLAQYLLFKVWAATWQGLPATSRMRRTAIINAVFYIAVTHTFWTVFLGVFVAYVLSENPISFPEETPPALYQIFVFLLLGKGYVTFTAWWFSNDPGGWLCIAPWKIRAATEDYTPQMNVPLRREVIFYTLSGVRRALYLARRLEPHQELQMIKIPTNPSFLNRIPVRYDSFVINETGRLTDEPYMAVRSPSPRPEIIEGIPEAYEDGDELVGFEGCAEEADERVPGWLQSIKRTLRRRRGDDSDESGATTVRRRRRRGKSDQGKQFYDYAPLQFRRIRLAFNVTDDAYLLSLSMAKKARLSEGASGAFMFYSADGKYIVKSCSPGEKNRLRMMVHEYADYLCSHKRSLITRFYGLHTIVLYNTSFNFVVMANIFDVPKPIHTRYDLKGSWVNRRARLPAHNQMVTCRNCNVKYRYCSLPPRSWAREGVYNLWSRRYSGDRADDPGIQQEREGAKSFGTGRDPQTERPTTIGGHGRVPQSPMRNYLEPSSPFSSGFGGTLCNMPPTPTATTADLDAVGGTAVDPSNPCPCISPQGHEPDVVLKDEDFTERGPHYISPPDVDRLCQQAAQDADFLCSQGIMDYSLLLGVHNEAYITQSENEQTAARGAGAKPKTDGRPAVERNQVAVQEGADGEDHRATEGCRDDSDYRSEARAQQQFHSDMTPLPSSAVTEEHCLFPTDAVEPRSSTMEAEASSPVESSSFVRPSSPLFSSNPLPMSDASSGDTNSKSISSLSGPSDLARETSPSSVHPPAPSRHRPPVLITTSSSSSSSSSANPSSSSASAAAHSQFRVNQSRITPRPHSIPPPSSFECGEGPEYYFVGLIDVLQNWTWGKRLERVAKVTVKCADGAGISAVPPEQYRDRFKSGVNRYLRSFQRPQQEEERARNWK